MENPADASVLIEDMSQLSVSKAAGSKKGAEAGSGKGAEVGSKNATDSASRIPKPEESYVSLEIAVFNDLKKGKLG